ncbi:molybdopterin-dependent oxidoreductase [Ornithinimicrobium sp. CNJ-824]|uniref:molybdopterin-dependent oxidoreductase n=1 Tax=Ornithinimicrobium sp. CNJ-824 TaxID=1904966 RepID=UPI00130118B2|nr:molybdopterin-dependent oxidoreductase [Ornithinimicrobium sp. CNJ-824]
MTGDGTAAGQGPDLPPGQRPAGRWLASHYGKVPQVDGERWRLTVRGATADGGLTVLDRGMLAQMKFVEVAAALHCVDRHSVTGLRWGGVRLADVVAAAPPEEGAHHVLLAASRGYSSAVLLEDLLAPDACSPRTSTGSR